MPNISFVSKSMSLDAKENKQFCFWKICIIFFSKLVIPYEIDLDFFKEKKIR